MNEYTMENTGIEAQVPQPSIGGRAGSTAYKDDVLYHQKNGIFVPGFSGKKFEDDFTILCTRLGIRPDIQKRRPQREPFPISSRSERELTGAASEGRSDE